MKWNKVDLIISLLQVYCMYILGEAIIFRIWLRMKNSKKGRETDKMGEKDKERTITK